MDRTTSAGRACRRALTTLAVLVGLLVLPSSASAHSSQYCRHANKVGVYWTNVYQRHFTRTYYRVDKFYSITRTYSRHSRSALGTRSMGTDDCAVTPMGFR